MLSNYPKHLDSASLQSSSTKKSYNITTGHRDYTVWFWNLKHLKIYQLFLKNLIWGLFLVWNCMWRPCTENKKQKWKTNPKNLRVEVEARRVDCCSFTCLVLLFFSAAPLWASSSWTLRSQCHSFSIESVTIFLTLLYFNHLIIFYMVI